jgi:transcriptional regulatory protein RtcR
MEASMTKKKVFIGFVGYVLDSRPDWKPTLSAFGLDDLKFDRAELITEKKWAKLNQELVDAIKQTSPNCDVRLHELGYNDPWDFGEAYEKFHGFTENYKFSPEKEQYYFHMTTGTHAQKIVGFLFAFSGRLPAELMQTAPPLKGETKSRHFLVDPNLDRYQNIQELFDRNFNSGQELLRSGIETRNKTFNQLIDQICLVASKSKDPILLGGETGTGKTALAKRIYEWKLQNNLIEKKSFAALNCATLQGQMLQSALFGHVKGAYTGAVSDRKGLMKAADGGVLFLDEIGELGLEEQSMLLHALESGVFYPLGSDKEEQSRFQLIAATNKDLRQLVKDKKFREDLLARIDIWQFSLPALRSRKEDFPGNIDFELKVVEQKDNTKVRFEKSARARYEDFAKSDEAKWTANFRDLGQSVRRMITLAHGREISLEVVEQEIKLLMSRWAQIDLDSQSSGIKTPSIGRDIDLFDRLQLEAVLGVISRHRTLAEAGRKLFHVSRERSKNANDSDRLKKYLERFGLDWRTFVGKSL